MCVRRAITTFVGDLSFFAVSLRGRSFKMIISYKLNWIFFQSTAGNAQKLVPNYCVYYRLYYCGAHLSWIHFAMGFHTAILELCLPPRQCVLLLVSWCLRCKWHSRVLLQVGVHDPIIGRYNSERAKSNPSRIDSLTAICHLPLAGLLAVYHSNRQVRAISAANGTPSLSQSSSARVRRLATILI